jgi:hypothetical protein
MRAHTFWLQKSELRRRSKRSREKTIASKHHPKTVLEVPITKVCNFFKNTLFLCFEKTGAMFIMESDPWKFFVAFDVISSHIYFLHFL